MRQCERKKYLHTYVRRVPSSTRKSTACHPVQYAVSLVQQSALARKCQLHIFHPAKICKILLIFCIFYRKGEKFTKT